MWSYNILAYYWSGECFRSPLEEIFKKKKIQCGRLFVEIDTQVISGAALRAGQGCVKFRASLPEAVSRQLTEICTLTKIIKKQSKSDLSLKGPL